MSQDLLSRAEGPIHHLTLNRPERRNALTPALARELAEALDRLEDEGVAQVNELAGAGGP
jgi:enoyl-CoA hydratase/carnithine racemase